MSQALMKKNLTAASLRHRKPPRTVLLRMAADERRAKRIEALKQGHPEVTWKDIADYVGVSERSAHAWRATGGIDPKNARKLTQFFQGLGDRITDDYVYRGDHEDVPNLMDVFGSDPPQPNVIEELLRELISRIGRLEPLADRVAELEKELELLRGQLAASDVEATARHEEVLRAIQRPPQQERPR
jgi:hypothetical protein